jgi:voltage-gated potassium channel
MTSAIAVFRRWCKRAFHESDSKTFIIVNDILSVVILISIAVIILESVPQFSAYLPILVFIEYFAVGIFTVEYICRIIGSDRKLSYIFSFFGIIDLISILPTLLHVANLTPLKSLRALRILRFLRVLRVAKKLQLDHTAKKTKKDRRSVIVLNIQIYALTVALAVVILGTIVHTFEVGNPDFESIPLSMLWVLETLLGGSISGITPQTHAGVATFMVGRFIGYILLGFLIHIVGNVISHVLLGDKEDTEEKLTT